MATKTIRLWAIMALVVVGTSLTACLKSGDTTPQRPVGLVAIINGIASGTSLDLYDNDVKVQVNPMPVGFGGVAYPIYAGYHTFKFTKTGNTAALASSTEPYDSLKYYTVIGYGDSTDAHIKTIKDDFAGATEGKLNIRFFNLSPNSPAVDLYIGDVKVDSNAVYVGSANVSTAFKTLTTVSSGSTIRVKVAGSTTNLVAETTTANLKQGAVYTIYLAGLKDQLGAAKATVGYVQSYY